MMKKLIALLAALILTLTAAAAFGEETDYTGTTWYMIREDMANGSVYLYSANATKGMTIVMGEDGNAEIYTWAPNNNQKYGYAMNWDVQDGQLRLIASDSSFIPLENDGDELTMNMGNSIAHFSREPGTEGGNARLTAIPAESAGEFHGVWRLSKIIYAGAGITVDADQAQVTSTLSFEDGAIVESSYDPVSGQWGDVRYDCTFEDHAVTMPVKMDDGQDYVSEFRLLDDGSLMEIMKVNGGTIVRVYVRHNP